MILIVLWRVPI